MSYTPYFCKWLQNEVRRQSHKSQRGFGGTFGSLHDMLLMQMWLSFLLKPPSSGIMPLTNRNPVFCRVPINSIGKVSYSEPTKSGFWLVIKDIYTSSRNQHRACQICFEPSVCLLNPAPKLKQPATGHKLRAGSVAQKQAEGPAVVPVSRAEYTLELYKSMMELDPDLASPKNTTISDMAV